MNLSKDLIIILIIALVIFGPSRLASLGGAVGKTVRDFRKSMDGREEDPPALPKPTDSVTH